jgi:hypothetical protein
VSEVPPPNMRRVGGGSDPAFLYIVDRAIQKGINAAEEGGGIPAEEVMERLRKAMEEPRVELAVWDKSLDRPLFPEG